MSHASQLAAVAADLDRRGYAYTGALRQAAQRIRELEAAAGGAEGEGDGCCGCGAPLVQPATGRPRRWCGERCRRRHRP